MYKIVFPKKYVCFYKVSVLNYILIFDESHASIIIHLLRGRWHLNDELRQRESSNHRML